MFVIFDFSIIVLFATMFIILYFLFNKLREINFIANILRAKLFGELIEGFIYGAIAILLNFLMTLIYSEVGVAFYYAQFIILLTIARTRVAAISLIPPLLLALFTEPINENTYLLMGTIMFFAITIIIADFYIKKLDYRIIVFPFFILIGVFSGLISALVFHHTTPKDMGYVVYTFVAIVFTQLLVSYSVKISVSANLLYSSINFNYLSFYRASFIATIIGELIKKEKIDKAIYGVFKFEWKDDLTKAINKELLETSLHKIEKTFPSKTILFHVEKGKYGFFLPYENRIDIPEAIKNNISDERPANSSLNSLNLLLTNSSSNLVASSGEKVSVSTKAGITIYGIQTNSLSEAYMNASFASEYLVKEELNTFNIFNPAKMSERITDRKTVDGLDEVFGLSNVEITAQPVFNKQQKEVITIYSAKNKETNDRSVDLWEHLDETNQTELFKRYVSIEAVKSHKNKKAKLAIPYSFSEFDKDFNLKEFINKLKLLGTKPRDLILVFDSFPVSISKLAITIIKELRTYGLSIGTSNSNEVISEIVESIKPEYIFIKEPQKINILEEATIVCVGIDSEIELIKADKNGIEYFAGKLFIKDIYEKNKNINIINIIKTKKEK